MERVKRVLSEKEFETLERAMGVYKKNIQEKMAELDQVQTHLKVNEGLMQEVRLEKDRLRKELATCDGIVAKIAGIGGRP